MDDYCKADGKFSGEASRMWRPGNVGCAEHIRQSLRLFASQKSTSLYTREAFLPPSISTKKHRRQIAAPTRACGGTKKTDSGESVFLFGILEAAFVRQPSVQLGDRDANLLHRVAVADRDGVVGSKGCGAQFCRSHRPYGVEIENPLDKWAGSRYNIIVERIRQEKEVFL